MKYLFKNAFFSFFQAKVAVILLAITVFISSVIFTMINSTGKAFEQSYYKVMKEGNVHDFAVKEKWKLGDLKVMPKIFSEQEIYELNGNEASVDAVNKKIYYIGNEKDVFNTTVTIKTKGTQKLRIEKTVSYALNLKKMKYKEKTVDYDSEIGIELYDDDGNHKCEKINKKTIPNFFGTEPTINKKNWNDWKTGRDVEINSEHYEIKLNESANGWKDWIDKLFNSSIKKHYSEFRTTWQFRYNYGSEHIPAPFKSIDIKSLEFNKEFEIDCVDATSLKKLKDCPLDNAKIKKKYNAFILSLKQLGRDEMKNTFMNDVVKYVKDKFKVDFKKPKEVKSLSVQTNKYKYKIVDIKNKKSEVDNLVVFQGSRPNKQYTDHKMVDELYKKCTYEASKNPAFESVLNQLWPKKGKTKESIEAFYNNKNILKNKGFKYILNCNLGVFGIGFSKSYTDFSALQTVVSSSYANQHNLTPITQSKLNSLETDWNNQKEINWNSLKRNHNVVSVDNINYIVTGIGTTPDFAFPIIDQKSPLPDTKTQAILFTNPTGYKRIHDSYRANDTEKYLAFKFKDNISKDKQKAVVKEINKKARESMSWPSNIKPVTLSHDINEKYILAGQRIAFLDKIKNSVSTVSYIITTLLIIFTVFIIIMVVKKQVHSKRKIMGSLLANGFSKNKIALSMMAIALIIIFIPAWLGYIVGLLLQKSFINIFNNYWTLPIDFISFSWIIMFITIMIPMVITMFISYVFTRIELRDNLVSIMTNENSSKNSGFITSKVLGVFSYLGVKTKITISLFTSNLSKMFLAIVVSAMTITSGGIAFSIIGRFHYANVKSAETRNDRFKLDLVTATTYGGIYNRTNINTIGLKKGTWETTSSFRDMRLKAGNDKEAYFHVLNSHSGDESKNINYLKNKIQLKTLLNVKISLGIKPWEIAKAGMPENQKNAIDKVDSLFNKDMYYLIKEPKKWTFSKSDNNQKKWLSDAQDIANTDWYKKMQKDHPEGKDNGKSWSLGTPNMVDAGGEIKISDYEILEKYVYYGLKYEIRKHMKNDVGSHIPFMISYNQIITDPKDEIYSQVHIEYQGKIYSKKETVSTDIMGIKDFDKSMINLSSNCRKAIKNANVTKNKGVYIYPVIINSYMSKVFGLKIGSIFKTKVLNHSDRYNISNHNVSLKVVAVNESYNGSKIYSSFENVNKMLYNGKDNRIQSAFNGVMSKKNNPIIFNGVNLYSPSGIYPASDELNDDIAAVIIKKIKENPGKWWGKDIKTVQQWIEKYSKTPYLFMVSDTQWSSIRRYTFGNILSLSNKIVWTIESITTIIAILFISIIASMIINDNKLFIATNKVLGYRNKEIKSMFFRSLIPSLVIATIISIPIAVGILNLMKLMLVSFGHILVPITLVWWSIPLAFLLIITIFSLVYSFVMMKFKSEQMLKAFNS